MKHGLTEYGSYIQSNIQNKQIELVIAVLTQISYFKKAHQPF